ncbi:hypothetical protein KBY72_13955 [Cyanobium sp. BA5m-21]|uniref:hypothetical protein n=1 Tax=unclassified Cyanobium TaxID=2627006 RepID=UPI0020CD2F00|nr:MULTISPECIES: hypothetical protein [unclassified Cyanobium]MCP9903114.1 hypothetical protein [Cyanobium sp. BA5m-10]MCP9908263.1 hypothetical protein [Cyanobium sp. BA5m-21]
MDLEQVVREHRKTLQVTARAVSEKAAFNLELPCGLVTDGEVASTTLTGLRNHLPCSVALASAPVERFLLMKEERGFDGAFEACSTDDSDGEAFVNAWDEAQKDLAAGVVCTLNDLVTFVEQARKGWEESPRRLLVVAVHGGKVESGTVPTDWVLRGV